VIAAAYRIGGRYGNRRAAATAAFRCVHARAAFI
jgi:hypothetical protein